LRDAVTEREDLVKRVPHPCELCKGADFDVVFEAARILEVSTIRASTPPLKSVKDGHPRIQSKDRATRRSLYLVSRRGARLSHAAVGLMKLLQA
jgi:hypothetical protein